MSDIHYRISFFSNSDIESRVKSINYLDSIIGLTIPVPVTLEGTMSWYQHAASDQNRRDFVLYRDEQSLGFSGIVSINHLNRNAELYIFMIPGTYGQGHGKELLKLTLAYAKYELNLRKIFLYVTDNNDRAIKFYESVGFQKEGTLKNHSWHRGEYVDRHIYSFFLEEMDEGSSYLYEKIR